MVPNTFCDGVKIINPLGFTAHGIHNAGHDMYDQFCLHEYLGHLDIWTISQVVHNALAQLR